MADGDFLACYLTSDFMALSFQKKLIENVIDAYKSDKSLADDPTFTGVRAPKKSVAAATIYTRMKGMMGWTEFDMKILLIFTTSQIIDLRYKLEHIIGNKYG